MLYRFKRLRIKTQLAILSLLVLVIISLLIVYSYNKFANVVEEKNLQANQNLTEQIKKSEEVIFDLFEKMLINLAFSNEVQSFLLKDDPVKHVDNARNINNLMKGLISLKDGIEDIILIGNEGDQLSYSGSSPTVRQVKSYLERTPKPSKLHASELMACPAGDVSCILLTEPIISLDSYGPFHKDIGTVSLLVQAKTLAAIEEDLYHDKDVILLITDRYGQLIANNNPAFEDTQPILESVMQHLKLSSLTEVIHDKHYSIVRENIAFTGGQLISITPLDLLHKELRSIRRDEITILIVSGLILSFLLGYIVNNIVRPLRNLMQFMQRIKRDTEAMKLRIDLDGYAEIGVVANEFNGMLNKIQSLTDENGLMNSRMYQIELERKNAQYHYLKSQINPHFLYNTLETIKGLAVMRGVHEIRDIAKALGQMFRYAVKGNDEIPLFKEMDIVDNYLQIQQYRFQDKIVAELRMDKNTMSYSVPKMILQPIVENAIYHGLEPKLGKGRLIVGSNIINQVLFLTVEDDGVGMPKDKLAALLHSLAVMDPPDSDADQGVGLVNVHRRIQLKYGARYGLEVRSMEGVGTTMTITLPVGNIADV